MSMRPNIVLLILVISLASVGLGATSGDSLRTRKTKFLEPSISFGHIVERGYFQARLAVWQETDVGYVTFMENEVALGYNPWYGSVNAELNHRQVWIVLTVGAGVGYATRTNFERDQFYFKPEVGLNLFNFQVHYTYSFTSNTNLIRTGSNLEVIIPIASTPPFKKFRDCRSMRWLGVFYWIDKNPAEHNYY